MIPATGAPDGLRPAELVLALTGEHGHNVVGDDFDSGIQESGTFAHRFKSSGTYDYRCTVHSGMTGRVVVN